MIDLIAFSCSNIGPFRNKAITVFFDQGKYLIKAPIGTGKSFLFFDGPVYGLYKASSRNILNAQSTEGFIKLIFSYNNEQYLVVRQLSKAKTKESCSSKLYSLSGDLSLTEDEKTQGLIKLGDHLHTFLQDKHIQWEEIVFKNETDLQQNLQDLLPPKEVFLNTVFLMQDSDNIFELQPAERLTVLKNVFGLMGIDEAKEVVAERKKEIGYKLKAYSDTSKYDEKLKIRVQSYTSAYQRLFDIHKEIDSEQHISFSQDIEELTTIQDKLTINNLESNIFSLDITGDIDTIIQDKKTQYQTLVNQETNKSEESKKTSTEIDTKRQQIFSIQKSNDELVKNINNLNPELLENLKTEKAKALQTQETIEQSMPKSLFLNFIKNTQFNELKQFDQDHFSMQEYYNISQQVISLGKSSQESLQTLEMKIKNKQLESQHKKSILEQEIKNLTDQKNTLLTQSQQIKKTIEDFENSISTQATYHCEKVGDNCPFIKVINKKTFDQLESQKNEFVSQGQRIQEQISTKEVQILEKQTTLNTVNTTTQDEEIQIRNKEMSTLQKNIDTIKAFLIDIQRKDIQEKYNNYQDLQNHIREYDKSIATQELLSKERENFQKQKEQNEGVIKTLLGEINLLTDKRIVITQEIETLVAQRSKISMTLLNQGEELSNAIKNTQRDIQNLIKDFKAIQTEINQLLVEEKQINQLYQILSKELALIILQDHLPTLNDIINNFLTQVVDYQVNLSLIKTSSDKIELEANIVDSKGLREIKSLSGGQKIILKLVWMLAISAYMNSPILFLDETINNLDGDTVGKVADMLQDTVKQRNIKIYTVTHNQQIQDMNIRDADIELGILLGVK